MLTGVPIEGGLMLQVFAVLLCVLTPNLLLADPIDTSEQEYLRELDKDFFVPDETVTFTGKRIPGIYLDGTSLVEQMRNRQIQSSGNEGGGIVGSSNPKEKILTNNRLGKEILIANNQMIVTVLVWGLVPGLGTGLTVGLLLNTAVGFGTGYAIDYFGLF